MHALLALTLAFAPQQASGLPGASQSVTFLASGSVTDGSQPLEGVPIGLVEQSAVDALPEDWMRIPLSQSAITAPDGSFSFAPVVAGTGERYYVLTGSDLHLNRIWSDGSGGLAGLPGLPTKGDFELLGAQPFVNDQNHGGIDFVLDESNLFSDIAIPVGNSGVTLLSDVYLATDGSLPTEGTEGNPVILVRTPYDKSGGDPGDPSGAAVAGFRAMTLLGYSVVIQNTRGRNGSGGTNDVFRTDGWNGPDLQDGFDTINWITPRRFCDGNVGMCGSSALAITGYLSSGSVPGGLKACYAWAGTGDLYGLYFDGGIYREEAMETWLALQLGGPAARDAYLNSPGKVVDNPHRSPFWRQVNLATRVGRAQVPMLHVVGWYDLFKVQGITGFEFLQAFGGLGSEGQAGARGNQRLLIGPYSHIDWFNATQGDLVFPPNAGPTMPGGTIDPEFSETLAYRSEARFFDHWLRLHPRGISDGYEDEPPVRYYVVGDVDSTGHSGNVWRETSAWPPLDLAVDLQRFYLVAPGRRLSPDPFAELAPPWGILRRTRLSYVSDPLDPVPTLGGALLFAGAQNPAGPRDQRPAEARPDVLTFTTARLTDEVEVTGEVQAHLAFSSDALDTDFVVKLTDVYPDGRSILVAEGVLQARYRSTLFSPDDLLSGDPDAVNRIVVSLGDTSVVFAPGHRIRLTVASSNSPRLKPNPQTGASFFTGDLDLNNSQPARNSVWTEFWRPARASWVELPIVLGD